MACPSQASPTVTASASDTFLSLQRSLRACKMRLAWPMLPAWSARSAHALLQGGSPKVRNMQHSAGPPGAEAVHNVLQLGAPVVGDARAAVQGLLEGEGPLLGHRLVQGHQAQVDVELLGGHRGAVPPGGLLDRVRRRGCGRAPHQACRGCRASALYGGPLLCAQAARWQAPAATVLRAVVAVWRSPAQQWAPLGDDRPREWRSALSSCDCWCAAGSTLPMLPTNAFSRALRAWWEL